MSLDKTDFHSVGGNGAGGNVSGDLIEEVNNCVASVFSEENNPIKLSSSKHGLPYFRLEGNINSVDIEPIEPIKYTTIGNEILQFFDSEYLEICNKIEQKLGIDVGTIISDGSIHEVKENLLVPKTYFNYDKFLFKGAVAYAKYLGYEFFNVAYSSSRTISENGRKKPFGQKLRKKRKSLTKEEFISELSQKESIYLLYLDGLITDELFFLSHSVCYLNFYISENELLFKDLMELYNKSVMDEKCILDKKYILNILSLLFLWDVLNNLYLNLVGNSYHSDSSDEKILLPFFLFSNIQRLKEKFIKNFKGYPFEIIRSFFGVDFNEKVGIDFINSLVGVKLRDISPDEKRKSIGRIVLQNHRLFCRKESIGYPKLFDYLCSDLSQEKYLSIEKYLLENKGKKLSQENLLFLFENNLEIYDLGEKRALTICVIGLFEEKVLNLENLENLLIPENLKSVINSGLNGGNLKALVCSVIENPNYFEENKNNNTETKVEMLPINGVPKEEKITTNVNYKGSKVLPPENNILYLQNELKAEFGKDNFELLGLGELVEESIRMILKIGQILGNKKLKERFIFVGDGNIRDIDINKLEQIYRILDFFSLHSISLGLVLNKLVSCSIFGDGFDKDRIDYVFKKLKPNKLPKGYKIKDTLEFIDIVLAYLEYGDESTINYLATNSKNCLGLQMEIDYDAMMLSILANGDEKQINEFGKKINSLIEFLLTELNSQKHTTIPNGRKDSKKVKSKNIGNGNNAQLLVRFIGKLKIQNGENHAQYLNRIKYFNLKSVLGDCFVKNRKIVHFINVFKDLETYFFSFMFHLGSKIQNLELGDVKNLHSLKCSYNKILNDGMQKFFPEFKA